MRDSSGRMAEAGAEIDAMAPAMLGEQGVVMDRVTGHKDQLARQCRGRRELEVTGQAADAARVQRHVEAGRGPQHEQALQGLHTRLCDRGIAFELAVARAPVLSLASLRASSSAM